VTVPTQSAQAPAIKTSLPATANGIARESRFLIDAERLAKSMGCASPVTAMNFRSAGTEQFTVNCSTGNPLFVACDDGICSVMQ
jgi:hypothetical protein